MSDYAAGKREFQADFVGSVGEGLSITKRPDAISFDYMTAFCQGPVSVGDVTKGVINFVWRIRTDGLNVWLARGSLVNTWEAEVLLFTITGEVIQEIDIAFEQAGRPVVCASRNTGAGGSSEVWLYWYKPSIADFTFEMFDSGRNPRVLMDYPPDTSIADVLFFYMKDGSGLVFRQQRDLYANILTTPVIDATNLNLEEVAYLEGWRIAAYFSEYKASKGQYLLRHLESKLYPVPVRDDQNQISAQLVSGDLHLVILDADMDPEGSQPSFVIVSGDLALAVIDHVLYDTDEAKIGYSIISGILAPNQILHTLYDNDTAKLTFVIASGTLVIVVVSHTLYDKDAAGITYSIISGTLA